MEVRLLKWEKFAVDDVLSKEKDLSTSDINTKDKYEGLNRRMEFLNERLKGVEKKIDRLLESNRTNLYGEYSLRRPTIDFTHSTFSNLLQRKITTSNETPIKLKQEETKISTRSIPTIINPALDKEKSFISPVDVTPKLFTSKSVLLDPNADPDLISK